MDWTTHEWIENFTEYEAVLRCLNPLPAWDKEATVRAFQTFEWNHASNPGGELEFGHQTASVVVRFDGAVVAILFGQGQLNEALPDLFAVLNSLGWQSAEVYHPAESLGGLLMDFGKAIPASMDFDVKPAKSAQRISDFAEVPLLVAQVHNAMHAGGGGNANDIILAELLSMDGPAAGSPAIKPSEAFAGLSLEDDVEEAESSEVVLAAVAAAPASPPLLLRPEGRQTVAVAIPQMVPIDLADLDDEAPRVFSAFGIAGAPAPDNAVVDVVDDGAGRSTNDVADDHAQTQADLVIENERLRDALSAAQNQSLVAEEEVIAATQAQEQAASLAQELAEKQEAAALELSAALQANATLKNVLLAAEEKAAGCVQANAALVLENERLQVIREATTNAPVDALANRAVKVGLSAFCFDLPVAPLSDEDTNTIAQQCGTQETIHLYPGAVGGSMRWDVLGEIESEYPWDAQKMAQSMGFTGTDSMLIYESLLDLKQSKQSAQLRDLLKDGSGDWVRAVGQILEPLSLCPLGQAFVDIAVDVDVDVDGMSLELFTVRGVMQSSYSRLFVVHVDALDGPFVGWMAGLLGSVVQDHAVSKRHIQVVRANDGIVAKNKEIALAQEKIVEEVNGVVGDLIAKLEKLRNLGVA